MVKETKKEELYRRLPRLKGKWPKSQVIKKQKKKTKSEKKPTKKRKTLARRESKIAVWGLTTGDQSQGHLEGTETKKKKKIERNLE